MTDDGNEIKNTFIYSCYHHHYLFRSGHFAVKRQKGRFNRVASDQTIEQTINKNQKCHGGITGYSTSAATVQRWVLTSHTIAQCEMVMEEDILIPSSNTKDIGKSRIKFDKSCVDLIYDVLNGWANPFESRNSLIHISSCVEVTEKVKHDLLMAEKIGLDAMKSFWNERLKSDEKSFYSPLKKTKLATFKNMIIKATVDSKGKSTIIAAERSILEDCWC